MKVSVILVSYNTQELTLDCLESIYKTDFKDLEIILVDNNSTDDSVKLVSKRFHQVKLILNKTNNGFGKANNQGIKKANGDLILFLNTDTIVPKNFFSQMTTFFKNQPQVGIASSRLVFKDGQIQQNGGALPNLFNIFAWQFFLDEIPLLTHFFKPYQQEDSEFYLKTQKTGWVSGAAMWIRKNTLDKIGGFDEKIFMYGEDVDLCIRATKKGYQVWTVAETQVTHLAHQSGDKSKAIIGEYKGLKYVCNKHYPRSAKFYALVLRAGAKVRSIVFKLLNKKKYTWYEEVFNLV